MCFFFFIKQKTAYEMRISDWSSDVCSSDLLGPRRSSAIPSPVCAPLPSHALVGRCRALAGRMLRMKRATAIGFAQALSGAATVDEVDSRSEERRVGKECFSTGIFGWSPYH